jgi:hypothetical protein
MAGSIILGEGGESAMYPWVYWSGITLLVVWTVLSAYTAISGI